MIKVYGFSKVTAFAHGRTRELRVLWALEEMGLPYDIEGMDHPAGEMGSAAFSMLNPFHQVPAVEDGSVRISESGAILLYLARKTGKLMPQDVGEQDQVIRWCFAALSTVELPMIILDTLKIAEQSGAPVAGQREQMLSLAHTRLADLEKWIAGRDYITSGMFTIADILMAHVLSEQIQETSLFAPYPQVRAYRERCKARPAWSKVIREYCERVEAA